MINKYTISSLRKGVNEMEKAKKKVIEEELTEEKAVEEATEKETEETPQAPEETPEVPAKEAEKEEAAVETTEVPGESPQVGETVVDETKQTAEKTADIEKRLEKLETEVVTPKATKEEVAFTKVVARFDNQIAKVVSVLEGLKERLEKVEAMAAPVKVKPSYLVEKSEATADTGKGAEIKKRLEELTHVRDTDLVRYQREGMQDEALRLLDELRRIQ